MFDINRQVFAISYAKAAKLFRKSAEQGDAIAQCALGGLYCYGNGVPKDYEEAAKWFHKAANQGHQKAKELLKLLEKIPTNI